MKFLPKLAMLAMSAGIILAAPAARADALYTSLSVSVWTGNGVTDSATTPLPTTAANYTFNYNGPLNFVNNSPNGSSNTFADFFNSKGTTNYLSDISNFKGGSWNTFLTTPMSTLGFNDNTYISFVGTYTSTSSTTVVSAYHDDGASLYTGVGNSNTVFTSSTGWHSTEYGSLPMGNNTPFDLVYVEANGAPAYLTVSGLSPVPEPGTICLMALGMIGLGALMYRGSAFNS